MKKIFLSLLFLGALACGQAVAQNAGGVTPGSDVVVYEHDYIVKVGDIAPDFTLELLDGTKFTLSKHRGKVVMLQFTAGWCGICRKEMPFIESDIWQRHKDNKDFVLVGIDREEAKDDILPFIEKVGTTYPIAMDSNGDVFASYALRGAGITRNILIDRDGKIVMLTRKFEELEFKALVEKIDAMLAERSIGVYSQVKTLNPVKTTPLPETDLVELEHLIRTVNDDYSKYQALEQKKRDMIDSACDDEVLSHFYSSSCSWYCGAELNSVESSSSLSDKYDANGAHDFSILNVWAEGAPDNGEGEYLLYLFPGSCPRITAVLVLNGYTKTEKAWKENGRVKKLMMYYNGKPYAVLNLEDTRALQRFDVGVLGFRDSKVPDWNIKFEILEVYPGEKYTDTVITELFFDGIDVH